MSKGSGLKRKHEYEELVKEFHESHRYANREEEVAARIVNKQREENGETKSKNSKIQKAGRPFDIFLLESQITPIRL